MGEGGGVDSLSLWFLIFFQIPILITLNFFD